MELGYGSRGVGCRVSEVGSLPSSVSRLRSMVYGGARRLVLHSLQSDEGSFQRSLGLKSKVCRRQAAGGFTLLELLVVIAIIALLAGLILAGLNVAQQRGRTLQARRDIEQIKTVLNAHLGDYGVLPTGITETGSAFAGVMRGGNRRGYTYMDFHERSQGMRDPWDNFYQFSMFNNTLRVWSHGPDGVNATDDDVKSWGD